MKCDRAQEWFSNYIDGSLGPAQAVVLESHLAGCGDCRRAVDGLRQVWTGLDAMPDLEAPASLRAQIWRRIQAVEAQTSGQSSAVARPVRRRPLWARLVLGGAAAALILAMAQVTVPGRYRPAGLNWLLGWNAKPTATATLKAERAFAASGSWAAHIRLRVPDSYSGSVSVTLQDSQTGSPLGEALARARAGNVDTTIEASRPVAPGAEIRVTVRDTSPHPAFREQTAVVR